MGLVIFLTSLVKKFAPKLRWRRVTVSALSVLYAALLYAASGLSVVQAAIAAVITGGGAVSIYEAYKGIKKLQGD